MIRVTVELVPHGNESRKRTLGVAEIANVGGDAEHGDYDVCILKWGDGRRTWKRGTVRGFPRVRLGPWDLLLRALASAIGGRNRGATAPDDDALPFGERSVDEIDAVMREAEG